MDRPGPGQSRYQADHGGPKCAWKADIVDCTIVNSGQSGLVFGPGQWQLTGCTVSPGFDSYEHCVNSMAWKSLAELWPACHKDWE